MAIDKLTRSWIRNESDERAAAAGCRFDLDRACWVPWWIGRYCRLYEGEWSGEPMVLRGAYSQPMEAILDEWDDGGRELSIERAHEYMNCFAAGEPVDWQYECIMRLFGWVKYSERWKREVRRFREAFILVAKKNKKTPTVSALALYLTCGDGEPGQKVFLAAKDGAQVRQNMSKHVLAMIEQSPELDEVCKVNRNEMSIAHLPSRSFMIPLSSSNSRTQESKEGLNGSVIVDETHVVDREFMKRITRTGISRSEPLRIEVTTAGNNPDGYGHERYEYAKEVLEGRAENHALFAAIYEAPQTISDADLDADPVKWGKLANPAWGHTIDVDEYLADYETSKPTIAGLADFKMYRLNVWQRSSNPWIRPDDWEKCQREFSAEDLLGKVCGGGLDLGKTDDMSSLSLVFPENPDAWIQAAGELKETAAREGAEAKEQPVDQIKMMVLLEQPVKVLTFYWLPEESVDKYKGDAPYGQWVQDGWLRTTSTMSATTVDPTAITADLRQLLRQFDVKMFAYDPWYAAPIIESLKKNDVIPEDYCWPFQQTVGKYAWPAALFERLILAGNLHHDGNPITRWEAGHVRAKEDTNGNMRPVKPPRGDGKKIDGIVSLVMALDAATRLAMNVSVYESRGVRSV
jgi:phage terminase large subunit-like protein